MTNAQLHCDEEREGGAKLGGFFCPKEILFCSAKHSVTISHVTSGKICSLSLRSTLIYVECSGEGRNLSPARGEKMSLSPLAL